MAPHTLRTTLVTALFICLCLLTPRPAAASRQLRHHHHHAHAPSWVLGGTCPSPTTHKYATGTCNAASDANHGYCMADFGRSCDAGVNENCAACLLWWDVHSPDGPCVKGADNCKVNGNHALFIGSQEVSTHHWKVVPTYPITGIEAITSSASESTVGAMWLDGWNAALGGGLPLQGSFKFQQHELGMVLNAARARSQHQLHIHIGVFDDSWANAHLTIDPKTTTPNKWEPVPNVKPPAIRLWTGAGSALPNPLELYGGAKAHQHWPLAGMTSSEYDTVLVMGAARRGVGGYVVVLTTSPESDWTILHS